MNETTIKTIMATSEIKNGHCQFNASSAKDFRVTLAKYDDARKNIADKIKSINASVSTYAKAVTDGKADLLAITNDTYKGHRTVQEIKDDIKFAQDKLAPKMKELEDYKNAEIKRTRDAEDLITDDLYNGYKAFCDNHDIDRFYVACANWLGKNGVEPCIETVKILCGLVGAKDNGNGAIVKDDRLQSAKTKKQFTKSFLNAIADRFSREKIIAPHKYEFVFKKKDK